MIDVNCDWVATVYKGAPAAKSCCGFIIPGADPAKCVARCAKKNPPVAPSTKCVFYECRHLVGNTDDDVEIIKPKGCGGCFQKSTRIFECDLHGNCAPLALGIIADDTVRDCRTCGDYKANPKNSSASNEDNGE